jgi:hypothetical protein
LRRFGCEVHVDIYLTPQTLSLTTWSPSVTGDDLDVTLDMTAY